MFRLALVLAAIGCGDHPGPESVSTPSPRVDASELLAKFECNRCHEIAGVAAPPRDKQCVGCHQQIHAGTFEASADDLERWRKRIISLRWAPSLAGSDRLRRAWLVEFLLAPHDVRPGLVAEMPRLPITRAEAERLAAHLTSDIDEAGGSIDSTEIERGEALYRSLACGRCHRFTGSPVDDPELIAAGAELTPRDGSRDLAPDLRHARARMTTSQITRWIIAPRGAMPALGIAPGDARPLAAFIAATPLAAPVPHPAVTRLPVLARSVTWDEVEAKVFRDTCWHCHAVPDFARGDGGPGMSGGFGFRPRGLDVSSYAAISAGALDDAEEPYSIFAALGDGTPRIVAQLLARHVEEAGDTVPGTRGMPLGLPALPLEKIQLVETWIAQGRPR